MLICVCFRLKCSWDHEMFLKHASSASTFYLLCIRIVLVKRFLTFIEQIWKSNKSASKFLLDTILHDTGSTTGSNLRNILLQIDKTDVSELCPQDAYQLTYHQIPQEEQWRLPFIEDIIEAKNGQMLISNILDSDLDEMLSVLCTTWFSFTFFLLSVGFPDVNLFPIK